MVQRHKIPPPRRWGCSWRGGDNAEPLHPCPILPGVLLRSLLLFWSCSRQGPRPCLADSVQGGKKTPSTPQPPQHVKKNVSVPCGCSGKKSGDASEPDWKQRRPIHATPRHSVIQSFDGGWVCLPHTRLQRGLAPASFPTSHVSLLPGLRGFKNGREVLRDRVTESATTCGRLITSLAQPNKWRLREKVPGLGSSGDTKRCEVEGWLLASSFPANRAPTPVKI